ncbi:MAG: T9SS type A sorting domain-containing protein [Crocinitomicaceae bacterium]|nr:T9SS type A sorting domain-containing protein [Crocinitomicaceae bacterium]
MKKQLITFSYILTGIVSYGQTSVVASGGSVSNNSGSISYSIGQVAYQSVSNSSGSVSQGVQHAFEISTLSLEENKFNFTLNAFPNPTTENLNLRVGNYKQEKLAYKLIDLEGKVISEAPLLSEETTIDMKQLPVATYFVEVHNEEKKVQTFKIIKNQ